MAKQLTRTLTMLVVLATLSLFGAVASANHNAQRQTANIPFDFVIGDETMPAGEYEVGSITNGGETLRVRGTENQNSAVRLSIPLQQLQPADKGKLVFRVYQNQYFLAEVWTAGDATGRRVLRSSREKALDREIAALPKDGAKFERVEVALVLH
jgi:hypothetical protein